MSYASDKQRRFFHTYVARRRGITPAMVKEYDQASKGMNLPSSAANRAAHDYVRRSKK